MARPKPKAVDDEERQAQFELIGDIVAAQEIAKRVFGDGVTAPLAFRVFDNLPYDADGELDDEAIDTFVDDLKKAQTVVGDRFGAAAASDAEIVLGLYERVFAKVEDEDTLEDPNEE